MHSSCHNKQFEIHIPQRINNIPRECRELKIIISQPFRQYYDNVIDCLKNLPETVKEVDLSSNFLCNLDITKVLDILHEIPKNVKTLNLQDNSLKILFLNQGINKKNVLDLLMAIPSTVKNVYIGGNYLEFKESDASEKYEINGADVEVHRDDKTTFIRGLILNYDNNIQESKETDDTPNVTEENSNILAKNLIILAKLSMVVTFGIAISRLVETAKFIDIFTSKIFVIMLGFSVLFSVSAYLSRNHKAFETAKTPLFSGIKDPNYTGQVNNKLFTYKKT